jgi:hypothetical protein
VALRPRVPHPWLRRLFGHRRDEVIRKRSYPSTCHEGASEERSYSSYSFSTSALYESELSASRPGRALPPWKVPPVPIVQEAGWAPEPVWTQRLEENSFRLCRGSNLHHQVVQSVARHCTELPRLPRTVHKA